ncbi:Uu.00g055690.m01.CDS01 [Anthostomella pinea]|uniref:Uu.00g055690.m01.CDS01 n=1 Tax=Anthostomella pinea TaxID=933095 RepID=A0AAI8VXJ7_9PEZI|nr:Uu.00g055690.m01.CDS01 [Anthostomella pinea]
MHEYILPVTDLALALVEGGIDPGAWEHAASLHMPCDGHDSGRNNSWERTSLTIGSHEEATGGLVTMS